MATLGCTEAFVAIATPHLVPLADFYARLLETPPQVLIPGVYAEFAIAGLKLGIFQPRPEKLAEFACPTPAAISLCLEVADLAVAIAHLTAIGHPPPGAIVIASHGQEIYAYDPDGNRLIFHQRP